MTADRTTEDSPESTAELRYVDARVHGRYWFVPARASPSAGTFVGFHGYGEDAERLLAEMRRVPGAERWSMLAIQALHPFYTRSGRVVASWMTKLDRELAIEDNLEYVARVIERVDAEETLAHPFVYLGFSQGTAMAYRAAIASRRPADAIVALGGDVPAELAEVGTRPFPTTLIGRGRADEWYTEEKEAKDRALLEAGGALVELFPFEGGHEWTDDFRAACGRFLDERSG